MASGGTRDPRRRLRPPKESPTGWLPPRPVRLDATPTKLLTRFVAAGGEVNLRARETQRQWDGHLPRGLQVANLFEKACRLKTSDCLRDRIIVKLLGHVQEQEYYRGKIKMREAARDLMHKKRDEAKKGLVWFPAGSLS